MQISDELSINLELRNAARVGDLETVKNLITSGADIHSREDAALVSAAHFGHLKVIKYLVNQGADIYTYGREALAWAAGHGHLKVVKYLVNQGVSVDIFYGGEALAWAAGHGHLKVVKYLVNQGVNIHAANDWALHIAEKEHRFDVVKFLEDISSGEHNGSHC